MGRTAEAGFSIPQQDEQQFFLRILLVVGTFRYLWGRLISVLDGSEHDVQALLLFRNVLRGLVDDIAHGELFKIIQLGSRSPYSLGPLQLGDVVILIFFGSLTGMNSLFCKLLILELDELIFNRISIGRLTGSVRWDLIFRLISYDWFNCSLFTYKPNNLSFGGANKIRFRGVIFNGELVSR